MPETHEPTLESVLARLDVAEARAARLDAAEARAARARRQGRVRSVFGGGALVLALGVSSAPQAMAQVGTTLASVAAQVSQLRTDLAAETQARQSAVSALSTSVNDVSNSVSTLGSRVTAAEGKVASLQDSLSSLQSAVASVQSANAVDDNRLDALETKTQFLSVSNGDTFFTNTNVNIRNGMGATDKTNGKGNLILGYNENDNDVRTGSHNLVVGLFHSYSSYAGVAFGYNSTLQSKNASVLGGVGNVASGDASAVLGGQTNTAFASCSAVSGGSENLADGPFSSVSGGYKVQAFGRYSSVSGGYFTKALARFSSVSGGKYIEENREYGWSAANFASN